MSKKTIEKAIKTYGALAQLDMVVEECAELIQAINKLKRSGNVGMSVSDTNSFSGNQKEKYVKAYASLCSEVADVKIMIEQMEIMLNKAQIKRDYDSKIERLQKRLDKK